MLFYSLRLLSRLPFYALGRQKILPGLKANFRCRRRSVVPHHRQCKGNNLSLRFTNTSQEVFHFSAIIFSDSVDVALVAVLQFSKGYFHTLKILLYLYINIELIFDFHRIYFGTATLQRCNAKKMLFVKCKKAWQIFCSLKYFY